MKNRRLCRGFRVAIAVYMAVYMAAGMGMESSLEQVFGAALKEESVQVIREDADVEFWQTGEQGSELVSEEPSSDCFILSEEMEEKTTVKEDEEVRSVESGEDCSVFTSEFVENDSVQEMVTGENGSASETEDSENGSALGTEAAEDNSVQETVTPEEGWDYALSAEPETEHVRPGQPLRYRVKLTNTGQQVLPLISLESSLEPSGLTGRWSSEDSLETDVSGQKAILEELKVGESRQLIYQVDLPEEFSETSVSNTITASASDSPLLKKSAVAETSVTPLKVDFTVNKTANRTTAAPGDTITYQICIRNTGERTLHSVLSTERFQEENIQAHFLEKEGVRFNRDKTQALISQIPPGEVFSLEAEVVLPEKLTKKELLNQVLVRTRETGEQIVESSASVQILEMEPSPESVEYGGTNNNDIIHEETVSVTDAPKTSDESHFLFWASVVLISLACLVFVLRKQVYN